ncbi:MAG: hypothetical protein ACLU5H_02060 [Alphaproteobacteria bacterium]
MKKTMIEIVKCSEYNVRAMKQPDFKSKICGFNFSYPVMNTIDICNLFINGGSIDISMNGKSKSKWSFDTEDKILKITDKDNEETHIISDIEELGDAMMAYFNENKDEINQKTLDTNMKKSKSKLGNQNARKNFGDICEMKNAVEWLQTMKIDNTGLALWGRKHTAAKLSDDEWEFLFKIFDLKTPLDEDICQNNYSY